MSINYNNFNRDIALSESVIKAVVQCYIDTSDHQIFGPERHLSGQNLSQILKTSADYHNKYRLKYIDMATIAKEIFDVYAGRNIHDLVTENQMLLTKRIIEHAHNLNVFGIHQNSLKNNNLAEVFNIYNGGFAKWLSRYDAKEKLPDYDNFYLFHLPQIAIESLTQNKTIDDRISLGHALLKAVESNPSITIYANTGGTGGQTHTGMMYTTHLWSYLEDKPKTIINQILKARSEKNKHKQSVIPVDPDFIKEPSGIKVVLSEAFDLLHPDAVRRLKGGKARTAQKPKL